MEVKTVIAQVKSRTLAGPAHFARDRQTTNVSEPERWLSAIGGSALAVYGLERGTLGGLALAAVGGSLVYRGLTGHCPCYASLGVSTAEPKPAATSVRAGHGVKIEKTFTINRPREEVYRFWRNFENLPGIMRHLRSVETKSDQLSHWVANGPLGITVEWDAEIHNEEKNRLIAWRSLADSEIETAGSVHFMPVPGGPGTQVRISMKYDPSPEKMAELIAGIFGVDLKSQIEEDLCSFKQMMEAGAAPAPAG